VALLSLTRSELVPLFNPIKCRSQCSAFFNNSDALGGTPGLVHLLPLGAYSTGFAVSQVGTCLGHGLYRSLRLLVHKEVNREEASKVNAVITAMVVYFTSLSGTGD
jgi:hypothetical protein